MYNIFINGTDQPYSCKDKEDATWTLGAKFGGLKYNELYRQGKIKFSENYVEVELDPEDEDLK